MNITEDNAHYESTGSEDGPTGASQRNEFLKSDLPDSPHDEERMKPETVILDLPDVEDIPGQKNIHVAPLGELADTTISSDDEEGNGLFDDAETAGTEPVMGNDADVTAEERKDLKKTGEDMPTDDDNGLRSASLDEEDNEGEPLNEGGPGSSISGADLDVSGAEADDADEDIGEEDEENNSYSVGGDDNEEETAETS